MNGIQIDHISDTETDLNNFLGDCTPTQIKVLCFNWYANSLTGILGKFYVNSLSKVVAAATKEVYFRCIDFSAEDLQTIVKAACNTERLIFRFC